MKIDTSLLQTGALATISVVIIMAAIAGNWGLVNTGLIGLFACLNIHPKQPGSPDDPA